MITLGPATGFTVDSDKTVDFDLRDISENICLYIDSTEDLTVVLKDGAGGGDDESDKTGQIYFVEDGSDIPVYDATGSSYSVLADTVKKIFINRAQLGDWLRIEMTNGAVTDATVILWGVLIK